VALPEAEQPVHRRRSGQRAGRLFISWA
jgi:hypothetical protein